MTFKADRTLTFEVPSSLDQLAGATRQLFDFLEGLDLNDSDRFDIRLSFEEVLINAMKHGNQFNAERVVKVTAAFNDKAVSIQIADEGKGFDHEHIEDPTDEQHLHEDHGRGVYLVKHLVDTLRYNAKGNGVEIIKSFGKAKKSENDR